MISKTKPAATIASSSTRREAGARSAGSRTSANSRSSSSRSDTKRAGSDHGKQRRTHTARFVSLRDDDEEEFALVRDPAELDPASRRVLEEALVAAGFVFEITRVTAIEEEVEIRHWRVETRQGARSFQTHLDAWPRLLPHGGLLVRDLAGDLYHLAAPE